MSLIPPVQFFDELESMPSVTNIPAEKLSMIINNIDSRFYEYIYVIILHYYKKSGIVTKSSIPYGGKSMAGGKGVTFAIATLPAQLQQLLSRFLTIILEYS